jgi:hypothetical protein
MSQVDYNIRDMMETSAIFNNKFKVLKEFGNLEYEERQGCKIGNKGGNLYISYNHYIQSVFRWWYNESRHELSRYLNREFEDYKLFLDMITKVTKQQPYNPEITSLREDNIQFIEQILDGVDKMQYIYDDFSEMEENVEIIKKNLNQFVQAHSDFSVTR